MKDVTIEGLPDWVVRHFESRARDSGRTLEEEIRATLIDAARAARHELIEGAAAVRQAIFERHGLLSDSTELIRRERDAGE